MAKSETTPDAIDAAYSVPLIVQDLPRNRPFSFDQTPDTDTLDALAEELSILSLRKVKFSGEIEAQDNGDFVLTGMLGATAKQACVISLEPVTTRIDAKVTRRFTKMEKPKEDEYQIQEEEDENTDELGDVIDLGLIATESVALNLPDFPRADTAEIEQSSFAPPGVTPLTDDDTKPFASLAALKDKLKDAEN